MSDFGDLFEELSGLLVTALDSQGSERKVIIVGGFAHMSKDMREQLFAGLSSPGVQVVTTDLLEARRAAEARKNADSLRDLEALLTMRQFDWPVKPDRMRQGKGERKRNKRHRYCSWMP